MNVTKTSWMVLVSVSLAVALPSRAQTQSPVAVAVAVAAATQTQTAGAEGVAALVAAQQQLQQSRAELLAPKAYLKATEALQTLQKEISSKAKADKLQKRQTEAQQAFDKATQVLVQSNKTLQTVIKAYDDAQTAGAATLGESWKKAEQRFKAAIAKVESNDLEDARTKGAEAEVLLRDVELVAIKNKVLSEARTLIAKNREAKLNELVPRTVAVAEQQLALADQQLSRNRYDVAEPIKLATQAAYEARHAQSLAQMITAAQSKDGIKQQLAETQWLALELPLRELAGELSVNAQFDNGYQNSLVEVRSKVQQLQADLLASRQATRDREQDIADLKTQLNEASATVKKLETRLGGESEERLALQKKLSAQERLRENISKVEAMFTADEGRVYRQDNNIILSLSGIRFLSGKSVIEPDSFAVLGKVADAAKLFADARLSIEGHTDNQGSESANLLLSQDRADAVREYLISNLSVNAEKISSIGYGASKPVTSNDTEAGRARNRRIDVVLSLNAQ